MRLFAWIDKKRFKSIDSPSRRPEVEERRLGLATTQRALAQRMEQVMRGAEKQLVKMVERIRSFQGDSIQERELKVEQAVLQRLLERCELVQTDTKTLLAEWRDWTRAVRQGVVTEMERAELVRSELRVRGVIADEEVRPSSSVTQETSAKQTQNTDSFEEWDQYLGETLPSTAVFWQARVKLAEESGESAAVIHQTVQRMRGAHAQAKVWKKMTERAES